MPIAPINRKIQVVTSPFGMRTLRGKTRMHRGVDLRSRSFRIWLLQDVVACEDCIVLRIGTDRKGNDYIVVNPIHSDYDEIKYIHVTVNGEFCKVNNLLGQGDYIGKTQIKGSSKSHHLHFETWKGKTFIDPLIYFDKHNINYRFK